MPTANHTPSVQWKKQPCDECCLGLNCGLDESGNRIFPTNLSFVASVTGSCPQADNAVQSGLMTFGPNPSETTRGPYLCDDLTEDGCETGWPQFCGCFWSWFIPEADVPLCGPYIEYVILWCQPKGLLDLPTTCPHVKYEHALWYIEIQVRRAAVLHPAPPGCAIDAGTGQMSCYVQNCETCLFEFIEVDGVPDDPCCPTCPPCFNCTSHNTQRCELNAECCGTTGCGPCVCGGIGPPCYNDCTQCRKCIEIPPGTPEIADPSCPVPCGGYVMYRYHYWVDACDSADDVKGCNATSCPPDDKNTGQFFLHIGCDENDYVEFACA